MTKWNSVVIILLLAATGVAQESAKPSSGGQAPAKTPAPAQNQPAAVPGKTAPRNPDRAAAYYHYAMAHIYE
jgi:hypothetical protein